MKINKSLDIDLNIISPQKHIRIHEGDVDSVDILIGVTVDDESVDLDGVTIKYDATINNYLAEQDADGSVVNDKISIPITQNMTAMSGLLLIDVRMIQNDQILFTQTICATVEKAVVNGSTYIDFDKITIIQRMNALEEKMDYIEELVENFDTSKLIVSVNRPPSGAPAEVDVDLLRVGDTWIQQGVNIVYRLTEAQYNYQPVPSAEPYHKYTWQPLNERYGVGNTEPPTSVTYQAVVYTINEVQWSWLPVPEFFKGDHYQMQVGVDDPTYYICKSGTMASTGVCTYIWREEGGAGDNSKKVYVNINRPPAGAPSTVSVDLLQVGDMWICTNGGYTVYELVNAQYNYQSTLSEEPHHVYKWETLNNSRITLAGFDPHTSEHRYQTTYNIGEETFTWYTLPSHSVNDKWIKDYGSAQEAVFWLGLIRIINDNYYFEWYRESTSKDLAKKMDLIPADPTDEQIAAMSNGQLYGDTVNHKGVIKGGQEFYDTLSVDTLLGEKVSQNIIYGTPPLSLPATDETYKIGDVVFSAANVGEHPSIVQRMWRLVGLNPIPNTDRKSCIWHPLNSAFINGIIPPFYIDNIENMCPLQEGDICAFYQDATYWRFFVIVNVWLSGNIWHIRFDELATALYLHGNFYDKSEIDSMIGDIETALSEV